MGYVFKQKQKQTKKNTTLWQLSARMGQTICRSNHTDIKLMDKLMKEREQRPYLNRPNLICKAL